MATTNLAVRPGGGVTQGNGLTQSNGLGVDRASTASMLFAGLGSLLSRPAREKSQPAREQARGSSGRL